MQSWRWQKKTALPLFLEGWELKKFLEAIFAILIMEKTLKISTNASGMAYEIWRLAICPDLPIAKHFNIELQAPFLDESLVRYAMQIHPSLKINHERRNYSPETAFQLGLPREVAFRKKIAAQYSSKFDRAIHRLAKKWLQIKKDHLQSLLKRKRKLQN